MSSEMTNPPSTAPAPADIWATNGGIYLGLTPKGGTNQLRPLVGKELERSVPRGAKIRSTWEPDGWANLYRGEGHCATFGPQGVGKTRKLFMPNLFKLRDWSIAVIDPKGENCAHTALARAANENHRVYVIDPCKVIETKYPRLFASNPALFTSCGFNMVGALKPYLLDEKGGKRLDGKGRPIENPGFIDDSKALAMALIQSDDARDPYWPMAAQALAKGVIMALRLDKPGVSDSLAVFRSYLGLKPQEFAEAIERDIAKFGEKWPAVAASLGEFAKYEAGDKEIGGIRRTAKAQTDWLDSPLFRADLSRKNVIDFASFKQTPSTCYLILPPKYLATHGMWLRIMLTSALMPLLDSVENARVPVLFMLDEFAQLGRMAMIENNIAQLRGFGVKLWTVWQDVEQMKITYGNSWSRFMATAEAKITFTSNDSETREYFSKLSGERLFKHTTQSASVNESHGQTWGQSSSDGTSSTDGSTIGSNSGNTSGGSHQGGGSTSGSSSGANYGRSLSGGKSSNTGTSNGGSASWSRSASTSEQHMNERCVRPYEIAALDADEALIFARRGFMHRAICPQPEVLAFAREAILEARAVIDGNAPIGRVSDRGPGLVPVDSRSPSSVTVRG